MLKFCGLRFIFLIFLLVVAPSLLIAQEAIPESTLKALKDATVFIRVDSGSQSGSGSGFLIGKRGQSAYIVTNEHVVRPRGGFGRSVKVDFFSGTKARKTFVASVVSEDESRDLAVLKIKNDDLPEPISLKSPNKIRETVPIYILGFPFGDALSTNRRGPGVTVGKGSVSSIRTNDFDEVEEVQVDGDINPGNSGGPIVFPDGTLMGVSVATVRGTQIGIGIPGDSVNSMLFGRVGAVGVSSSQVSEKKAETKFTATLIDPLQKMKQVSIVYAKKDTLGKVEMPEDGKWKQISKKMKEVKLKIDGQQATGSEKITGDYGERLEFLFQVKFTNGKNETVFTGPSSWVVRIDEKATKGKTTPKRGGNRGKSDPLDDLWVGEDPHDDDSAISEAKPEAETPDDGWIGGGDKAAEGKQSGIGELTESSTPLGGEEFTCLDATCQDLSLDTGDLVENLVWSRDHEHFFVLSRNGMLRKISFPGLKEELTLDFKTKCSWMVLSQEGLCVMVPGIQDLVLLDEDTLKSKKKFPVGTATHFGASPDSPLVYINPTSDMLMVANLETGEVERRYKIRDFGKARVERHEKAWGHLGGAKLLTVSPDGKYLFFLSGTSLHKFRIDGNKLIYEEVGEGIARNSRRIEISSDSSYVAVPSGGGNGDGYTTYVYPVKNILKKAVDINGGAYPRALALDKKAGLIYSHDHGTELKTFSPGGSLQKSYDLGESGGTNAFLVHPDGGKILVLHSKITYVQLPE